MHSFSESLFKIEAVDMEVGRLLHLVPRLFGCTIVAFTLDRTGPKNHH